MRFALGDLGLDLSPQGIDFLIVLQDLADVDQRDLVRRRRGVRVLGQGCGRLYGQEDGGNKEKCESSHGRNTPLLWQCLSGGWPKWQTVA